jgi:cysteine desulfurase
VGFLALSSTADIRAVQPAGGQESGLRGGTENVAGAVGLAVAAEAAFSHLSESHSHTSGLAKRLFEQVRSTFPKAERLGNADHRLGHILSMRIPGIVGATLLERMNAHGVAFSTGAACHGKDESESQVLKAIGLSRLEAREVVRFSFCRFNTLDEVNRVGDLLEQEAKILLAASPRARVSKR